MQEDREDVLLLKKRPFELFLKYQPVFRMIVRKYACSGYFLFEECDEVLQHLNERLFSRADKIAHQFDHRSLVRTYLSAICRNIIAEQIRSSRRRMEMFCGKMAMEAVGQMPYHANFVFKDEFKRLDNVMLMFGDKRHKLWLMMKLVFRIQVTMEDFRAVIPGIEKMVSQQWIDDINGDVYLRDKQIYKLLFPLLKTVEKRLSHPDTLRKWFNLKTADLIALMNGYPVRAAYAEDTLQILVEKYCDMAETGEYMPVHQGDISAPKDEKNIRILRLARRNQL